MLALGCGGVDVESPPSVDAGSTPGQATTDAGVPGGAASPEPVTTCCRLDNERGERLNYMCGQTGVALDVPKLEGQGYRCWLVL